LLDVVEHTVMQCFGRPRAFGKRRAFAYHWPTANFRRVYVDR
jgi:hypothetical protein